MDPWQLSTGVQRLDGYLVCGSRSSLGSQSMKYEQVLEVAKTFLITVVCTVMVLFLLTTDWLDNSEDDPYSVTIEYDCRAVAKDPSDIPEHVIRECVNIFEKAGKPENPQKTTSTVIWQ